MAIIEGWGCNIFYIFIFTFYKLFAGRTNYQFKNFISVGDGI